MNKAKVFLVFINVIDLEILLLLSQAVHSKIILRE